MPLASVTPLGASIVPPEAVTSTRFPASGCPLPPAAPFVTNTVMVTRRPGSVEAGLADTRMRMSADVFAKPVVGAGLPVHSARTVTPPFCSRHSNTGPVVPPLSEHAWISVPAIRRSPKTTRVQGRTAHRMWGLARSDDRLASMVLAP